MVSPHKPLRALVVVRLSRLTDESTSPERQREACEQLCDARGWTVVGVAEDLDVSAGTTSPFQRPTLSQWIGDNGANPGRAGEFDVLVFYRVDRLVRRVRHLGQLLTWSEQYHVNMVSATESHFDLSTPIGRVIAQLVASFAEMELEAISERIASAYQHNRKLGKWTGGAQLPWGYLPRETKDGWRLFPDPEAVPVIHEVAERVLAGEPLRAVAHDLNERGVPTAKDRMNQHRGRPLGKNGKPFQWTSAGLKRSMTSPTMLGYVTKREPLRDAHGNILRDAKERKQYGPEEILRGSDGSPVQRAEPILTREVFDRVGIELAERENRKEPTKRTNALLLRVIYCDVCGRPAYQLRGGQGRSDRYRCSSAQYKSTCGNRTVVKSTLDDLVESAVLELLGSSERLSRVWDAGEDYAAELADLDVTLTDLAGQIGLGVYRAGTPQREVLDARIAELSHRRDELAAITTRPAGWAWRPTGQTFSDWWEGLSIQERNVYLRSMGVTVRFDKREELKVHLELGEIYRMASEVEAAGSVATVPALFDSMTENGIAGVEVADGKAVFVSKTGERVEFPLRTAPGTDR